MVCSCVAAESSDLDAASKTRAKGRKPLVAREMHDPIPTSRPRETKCLPQISHLGHARRNVYPRFHICMRPRWKSVAKTLSLAPKLRCMEMHASRRIQRCLHLINALYFQRGEINAERQIPRVTPRIRPMIVICRLGRSHKFARSLIPSWPNTQSQYDNTRYELWLF
jgi:hypothetical protein